MVARDLTALCFYSFRAWSRTSLGLMYPFPLAATRLTQRKLSRSVSHKFGIWAGYGKKQREYKKVLLERRLSENPLHSWRALADACESSTPGEMNSVIGAALSAESEAGRTIKAFLRAILVHKVPRSQQEYVSFLQRINERSSGILFGYAKQYFASVSPFLTLLLSLSPNNCLWLT